MRQVKLTRPVEGGHAEEVCWIANTVARLNHKVKDEDGVVWTVSELYGALPSDTLGVRHSVARAFGDVLDG